MYEVTVYEVNSESDEVISETEGALTLSASDLLSKVNADSSINYTGKGVILRNRGTVESDLGEELDVTTWYFISIGTAESENIVTALVNRRYELNGM